MYYTHTYRPGTGLGVPNIIFEFLFFFFRTPFWNPVATEKLYSYVHEVKKIWNMKRKADPGEAERLSCKKVYRFRISKSNKGGKQKNFFFVFIFGLGQRPGQIERKGSNHHKKVREQPKAVEDGEEVEASMT